MMNLICFPFAGGSAHTLLRLQPYLKDSLRLVPADPPGRGLRSGEPLLRQFKEMVTSVYREIEPVFQNGAFALFGHSMGAFIAAEIVKLCATQGGRLPVKLIVGGAAGPSPSPKLMNLHHLNDREMMRALQQLGGMVPEAAESPEFEDLFLPILRADIEALSVPAPRDEAAMPVPVTVLLGTQDPLTREEAPRWRADGEATVETVHIPGGHFFVLESPAQTADAISAALGLRNGGVY